MSFTHYECLSDDFFCIIISCNVFEADLWLLDQYAIAQFGLELAVVFVAHLVEKVEPDENLVLLIILQLSRRNDVNALCRARWSKRWSLARVRHVGLVLLNSPFERQSLSLLTLGVG